MITAEIQPPPRMLRCDSCSHEMPETEATGICHAERSGAVIRSTFAHSTTYTVIATGETWDGNPLPPERFGVNRTFGAAFGLPDEELSFAPAPAAGERDR